MYDIIVIGGGPTGSLCSYLLSKNGFDVALIEKVKFPRVKLCGGGISYKACQILENIINLSELSGKALSGSYLCFKNEHLTHVGQDVTSYSLERSEMDYKLLLAAKEKGTEIFMPSEVVKVSEESNKVVVTLDDGKVLETSFMIFAEGINGQIHQQIGYYGDKQVTMALEIDVYPENIPESFNKNTLFDFGAIPAGYGWVFPKKDYLNVGAYFYHSPKISRSQISFIQNFINQFEWAKKSDFGKIQGHALPYNIKYEMYNTQRTLLIGDVAGAVENFYGEGLFYGLSTSILASKAITNKITNNISLDEYSAELKRTILNQIYYSRITSNLFYTNQKFGYYRMVRNKLMNRLYADLIHGKISQKKCFYLSMISLPLSLFSKSLDNVPFRKVGLIKNEIS